MDAALTRLLLPFPATNGDYCNERHDCGRENPCARTNSGNWTVALKGVLTSTGAWLEHSSRRKCPVRALPIPVIRMSLVQPDGSFQQRSDLMSATGP